MRADVAVVNDVAVAKRCCSCRLVTTAARVPALARGACGAHDPTPRAPQPARARQILIH